MTSSSPFNLIKKKSTRNIMRDFIEAGCRFLSFWEMNSNINFRKYNWKNVILVIFTSVTILNSNLIFSIINHNTNRNCFVPFCFQNVNIYLNEAIIHILLMKPSIQSVWLIIQTWQIKNYSFHSIENQWLMKQNEKKEIVSNDEQSLHAFNSTDNERK